MNSKEKTAVDCSTLQELYDWCLQQHYKKNDHHPEHFSNADLQMPIEAKIELTCDLLACVFGLFKKQGKNATLSECRYIIENQKWRHWIYAITEHLPKASDSAPSFGPRWKKFPPEELEILDKLFQNYKKNEISSKDLKGEMEKLDSIKFYLNDLEHHKNAVEDVWKLIPKFNTSEMEKRIKHHDDDKYDTCMILGYTAKWCF